MSNATQTLAILGVVIAMVGVQTFWIARALDRIDRILDRLDSKIDAASDGLASRIEAINTTLSNRLDEVKTEIVRDHGERIAKLEERVR